MSRRRTWLIATVASAALITAGISPAAVAAPEGLSGTTLTPSSGSDTAKSRTGGLAQSDESLLSRSDAAVVPALLKLDVDPVASYAGGVEGFAATSPEVTGKKLSFTDPAVIAYRGYVDSQIKAATDRIAKAVPSAKVLEGYSVAYGGVAVTVPASSAKALLAVEGVTAVQDGSLRTIPQADAASTARTATTSTAAATASAAVKPAAAAAAATLDNDASTFIGADKVWPSLGGRDKAGAGVIVGVIDTGIWPEHPMLNPTGLAKPAGGPWACELGNGGDAAFSCNNKLVGAYAFLDTYQLAGEIGAEDFCTEECSARDSEGHGTHTATTAAGSYVADAPIFGTNRGPASGMAPGASVIAYRALGPQGGYTADLLAAVQQTIIDGVDVINYSVSGSGSVYSDPVELGFLDAYAAGISVNASAGNSGPGASTADHAGPWTTTVGASTFDRAYESTLTLTSSDGATFTKAGSTITAGVTDVPIVLATAVPGYTGGAQCSTAFPEGSLVGKVVVCERGGTGRVAKGIVVADAGAEGMILYNPTAQATQTDNHFLPAIHLEGPNTEMLAFVAAHPDVKATWATGQSVRVQGDVMAGFSSRGPIGEFLKPDITAPGVQIIAGLTPESTDPSTGPQGELYQAIAGTSMSAPHAAGLSALVIAAHPDWTPGQVKSALMTSSVQSVVNSDGSPAGVFDRGAGSIRADRAVSPTLTISETAANFASSATTPLTRNDLNIPSIYVDPLPGAETVTRTVTNVSKTSQTISVSASAEGGVKITPFPVGFVIAPGASKKVTFTIDAVSAENGWHEGSVTLKSNRAGAIPVVLPVAVDVADAEVTLAQSCTPTEIARRANTTCTVTASNFLPVDVPVSIEATPSRMLQLRGVTAPATQKVFSATWNGTLSAALPPTVDAITQVDPATTPSEGYLPLSLFGVATTALGDEAFANFTVPAFRWGGETYESIGVVSNGYVVMGGATSSDVEYEPTDIPNPAPPNNFVAPVWTDLNPEAGGTVRVGSLTGGGSSYLVVEFEDVPTFSGNATNSFQVWIQAGATERVWFATDGALVGDAAVKAATGAENRTGESGVTVALPTASSTYEVTTGAPTPGGTATFDYTLRGLVKGTWPTTVTLRSPLLGTVPKEETKITVK